MKKQLCVYKYSVDYWCDFEDKMITGETGIVSAYSNHGAMKTIGQYYGDDYIEKITLECMSDNCILTKDDISEMFNK